MKDNELQAMMDAEVKNVAKAEPAKTTAEAVAKDAEYKAVEDALAGRIVNRLREQYPTYPYGGYGGYAYGGYPYSYPLNGYYDYVDSLRRYHDWVHAYDLENHIVGAMLDPSVTALLDAYSKILGPNPTAADITAANKASIAPAAKPAAGATATKPAATALLQTEGVPVFVNPILMSNTAGSDDLLQRNFVVDGVNGFDFVQLEETVVLQVNGVPRTINL